MKRWEHQIFDADEPMTIDAVNEMGEAGWELVTHIITPWKTYSDYRGTETGTTYTYAWKRPKPATIHLVDDIAPALGGAA